MMAVAVIHLLKEVEVDQEQGKWAITNSSGNFVLHDFFKFPAVEQARESGSVVAKLRSSALARSRRSLYEQRTWVRCRTNSSKARSMSCSARKRWLEKPPWTG